MRRDTPRNELSHYRYLRPAYDPPVELVSECRQADSTLALALKLFQPHPGTPISWNTASWDPDIVEPDGRRAKAIRQPDMPPRPLGQPIDTPMGSQVAALEPLLRLRDATWSLDPRSKITGTCLPPQPSAATYSKHLFIGAFPSSRAVRQAGYRCYSHGDHRQCGRPSSAT